MVEYTSTLPSVVHVEENLFSCSTDSSRQITETIMEKGLNRVVVAACTPRTHEALFQDTLREAGINKYGFVMANIREHSSWVHSREKERATQKAKDIVRMSVARAVRLRPLKEMSLPVNKRGLVLGGGLAGMTSALSMANQGFEAHLVEKSTSLGGTACRIYNTLGGMDVQAYLGDLIRRVYQNPLVHVHTDAEVTETSGYVGNFTTRLISGEKAKEIHHGITIIATGADEYRPTEYLYAKDDRVLTLLQLEERIAQGDKKVVNAKSLVVILCVGSRQESRPHCSRVCCAQAIKCVLKMKAANPGMDIYILFRDMRMYGFKEDYYREAADQDVKFIRYDLTEEPEVELGQDNSQGTLRVTVTDAILNKKLTIDTDILALGVSIIPRAETEQISRMWRTTLSQDGFFSEAHMKLRPIDLATEGIFLCGTAHFPKTIDETIIQANAAASRAATILSKDTIIASGIVCEVNRKECTGCALCQEVCQYGAIELEDRPEGKKAGVMAAACEGCGVCNSVCPTGAISLGHFTDSQIFAEIDAAYSVPGNEAHFEPKIIGFLCNWCGYAGSDMAGVSRLQYAPNVREIRVMCSSRIHPRFIMEAFLNGIDGVLVCGCHLGDCHYMKANYHTEKTIKAARKALEKIGINPERLRQEYISASEGVKYAEIVNNFTSICKKLGPLKLNAEQKEKLLELKLKKVKEKKLKRKSRFD
jgi:heterodisulfide reductase subunit A